MGRKTSEGNAPCIRLYKSLFGIRILLAKQMFATITQAYLLLLRT
jgi:hypothetical protein